MWYQAGSIASLYARLQYSLTLGYWVLIGVLFNSGCNVWHHYMLKNALFILIIIIRLIINKKAKEKLRDNNKKFLKIKKRLIRFLLQAIKYIHASLHFCCFSFVHTRNKKLIITIRDFKRKIPYSLYSHRFFEFFIIISWLKKRIIFSPLINEEFEMQCHLWLWHMQHKCQRLKWH